MSYMHGVESSTGSYSLDPKSVSSFANSQTTHCLVSKIRRLIGGTSGCQNSSCISEFSIVIFLV